MPSTTTTTAPTADPTPTPSLLEALRANIPSKAKQPDLLPSRLSPSRVNEFTKCPRAYFYKHLCHIAEPSTVAQLRGTLFHGCAERLFDHPAHERTPEVALQYLDQVWESMVNPDLDAIEDKKARARAAENAAADRACVEPGSAAQEELFETVRTLVRAWFDMERLTNVEPANLTLPDGTVIDGREFHALAELGEDFIVHGFIDRLDQWKSADGNVHWSVTDYKSSAKAGWLKKPYAEHTAERIREEAFFQLRVYALLLWLMFGIKVEYLRLVFVGDSNPETAVQIDRVTSASIDQTGAQLNTANRKMRLAAERGAWPTTTSPLCDWCYFRDICPTKTPEIAETVNEIFTLAG